MKDLSKKTKDELISEIKALKADLSLLKKTVNADHTSKKVAIDISKNLNFFKLAETSPSAILIYRKDSVCYVNKSAVELTGYSKNELLKMKFWEVISHEDRKFVKDRGHSRLAGNKMEKRYEFRVLTKSNEIR